MLPAAQHGLPSPTSQAFSPPGAMEKTMTTSKIIIGDSEYDLPTFAGTENETAVDISKLRAQSSAITYDPGYGNTGSCKSAITFIDGEMGILRYRGYPIEELAEKCTFPQVAYLLINGEMPTEDERKEWRRQLRENSFVHEGLVKFFDHFPVNAHPMNILASMVSSMSSFYPHDAEDDDHIQLNIQRLLGQVKSLAAFSYKKSIGQPYMYPQANLSYTANFLRMMFATPA
jgi:citrate synthase